MMWFFVVSSWFFVVSSGFSWSHPGFSWSHPWSRRGFSWSHPGFSWSHPWSRLWFFVVSSWFFVVSSWVFVVSSWFFVVSSGFLWSHPVVRGLILVFVVSCWFFVVSSRALSGLVLLCDFSADASSFLIHVSFVRPPLLLLFAETKKHFLDFNTTDYKHMAPNRGHTSNK